MKVIFRGNFRNNPRFSNNDSYALIIGRTYEFEIEDETGCSGTSGGGPELPKMEPTRKTPLIDPKKLISYGIHKRHIKVKYKPYSYWVFDPDTFEEFFTTPQEQRKIKLEKINGINI